MSHAVLRSYSNTVSAVDPQMYIFSPSSLKNKPSGIVSCAATLKFCKKLAVLTFHAVLRSYSFTSSPLVPMMYIFSPSGLKNNPAGRDSCAPTLKLCRKTAVVMSHSPRRTGSTVAYAKFHAGSEGVTAEVTKNFLAIPLMPSRPLIGRRSRSCRRLACRTQTHPSHRWQENQALFLRAKQPRRAK